MNASPSLLSSVIQLTSARDEALPLYTGRAVHGWFLQQVQALAPDLAAELHQPNVMRPWTLSDIWGPGVQRRSNERRLLRHRPIFLRITSFASGLTSFLLSDFFPNLPSHLQLDGFSFAVERAVVRPDQTRNLKVRPWLRVDFYEKLIAAHAFQPAPHRRLQLHFASPTVFKSDGKYALVPTPRLVFESLARRWNEYAPVPMHPEIVSFAKEHVVISSYRLHTVNIPLGGKRGVMPVFVGECAYALQHDDAYWLNNIHLLAAFARYAGVGKNTAMGLGQTRLLAD